MLYWLDLKPRSSDSPAVSAFPRLPLSSALKRSIGSVRDGQDRSTRHGAWPLTYT